MSNKKNIVVWFSCGAASAVAAKLTLDKFGTKYNVIIANTPVTEEHPDNIRFKEDVSKWLGVPIIEIRNKERSSSCVDIWKEDGIMSTIKYAPCTKVIKKQARYNFEEQTDIYLNVLGFTVEEIDRHLRFVVNERYNHLPILIANGYTKQMCFEYLQKEGIKLPEAYKYYPNANCIGCVKASSPTYWNKVRKHHPEVFEERAKQSRELNCKLVKYKGERMFLDELPINAKGGKLSSVECSIFCDVV